MTTFRDAVSKYTEDAVYRLERWRERTLKGFDLDLRSQVFHDRSRQEVMDEWQSILFEYELDPVLKQFELSEQEGIGPYSLQMGWHEKQLNGDTRAQAARDQFGPRPASIDESAYNTALEMVRSLVPRGSLSTLRLEVVLERTPSTTNLGLPEFSRDRRYVDSYERRARAGLSGKDWSLEPWIAGWRGQPGGMNPDWSKQRLLYMGDHAETWAGGAVMYPILDYLRDHYPEHSAWVSDEAVADRVLWLLRYAARNGLTVFSTDFSGFDASIPARILHDVFDAMRWWFSSELHALPQIEESFIQSSLLTPDGLLRNSEGGIPSGSVFTGLVGTIVNRLSAFYIATRLGTKVEGTYLGDDALNVYASNPTADDIEGIGNELNLDLNASKQYVARGSAHYLQNVFVLEGRGLLQSGGIRPTFRALNGILSYERQRNSKDWTPALAAVRTITQLERCKYHPAHRDFVKFIAQGDRRLLQEDPMRLLKRGGGAQKANDALGFTAYRYSGADAAGFASYRTVSVLREPQS